MILEQLNRATGPVEVLLPLKGLRSFVQPGETLHDPEVEEAIFDEFRQGLRPDTPRFELDICLMDPEFSECAADRMLQLLRGPEAAAPGGTLWAEFATACAGNIFPPLEGPALMAAKATDASFWDSDASAATVAHFAGQSVDGLPRCSKEGLLHGSIHAELDDVGAIVPWADSIGRRNTLIV